MGKFIIATVLLVITSHCHAQKQIVIGTTWSIKEPDPIELAKERAKNIPPEKLTPKNSYRTKLAATSIIRVTQPSKQIVVPSYTLDKPIYDKTGAILYPAGFTYNFLEYSPFKAQRIVIIDEQDAQHIRSWVTKDDVVIVNKGDLKTVSDELKRHVNMLDKLTAQRLDLKRVPILIYREQNHFVYHEFMPEEGEPL